MADQYIFQIDIEGVEISAAEGQTQGSIQLAPGKNTIGRVPGNTIVLGHPLVSRSHASLEVTGNICTLTDLGSANGTILNGNRIQPNAPETLSDMATISIGPFDLKFTATLVSMPEQPQVVLKDDHPQIDSTSEVQENKIPPDLQSDSGEFIQDIQPIADSDNPEGVDISRVMPSQDFLSAGKKSKGTIPPPPPSNIPHTHTGEPDNFSLPPGLDYTSQKLLQYLPGIYQTDFMSRFLALFESILTPIEWNIDNFDLFLDPGTSPGAFLPWLANWYQLSFDSTWTETKRRVLLSEAAKLYARRGTHWALARILEIYLGKKPEIIEFDKNIAPYTFVVRLPFKSQEVNRELIMQLIDANKPAYTTYSLEFL